MQEATILWADDEIDLLKPHILFLKSKGYEIKACNNGGDAIDLCKENNYDLVFLDEHMPGISGLEALNEIKQLKPSLPVVMITKSEEEMIMEEAIGAQIADYLIKPVNPNQILHSIKKILEGKRLFSEKATSDYGRSFGKISMDLYDNRKPEDWLKSYDSLTNWEIKLEETIDQGMSEILDNQKGDANALFGKFVADNYQDWLKSQNDEVTLSHNLLKEKFFPKLKQKSGSKFLLIIDNLRLDQFKAIESEINELFRIESKGTYFSILPTSTEFARNALFSGLMPSEIERKYPKEFAKDWSDEGSRNMNEHFYFQENLKRNGIQVKSSYTKILNLDFARQVLDNFNNLLHNDVNVIVYNFVDLLSHARSEMRVLKELAENEKAYRSLTVSWFKNSPLLDILKKIAESGSSIFLSTDHGSIKVKEAVKILGDRETTSNLRYKEGRNLNFDDKNVFRVQKPESILLPKPHMSSSYAFSTGSQYFVYPNNYNHYVQLYKDTFQHGGISMEEMIIPYAFMSPR